MTKEPELLSENEEPLSLSTNKTCEDVIDCTDLRSDGSEYQADISETDDDSTSSKSTPRNPSHRVKIIIIHQIVSQQYKIHTHQTVWFYHQSQKLANIILHRSQTIILRLHLWLALMMNHQQALNHQEHISKPLYQWTVLLF